MADLPNSAVRRDPWRGWPAMAIPTPLAVYPEARLAARSGQRGTSGATTGGGGRSAPDPDKVAAKMSSDMLDSYEVAIVGGGPVGVALAVELGQRGISCVLVERHLTPQPIPKGQNLTNRTLEHFYFWHCVDELRAARVMPRGYPIGGVTAYGNLMSPYYHAMRGFSGRGAGVQDFYFQRNERLPQYCTEAVLRNRMRDLPSVTALFGWNAEQVQQADDEVRLTVAPVAEGSAALYSWSADTPQQVNTDSAE